MLHIIFAVGVRCKLYSCPSIAAPCLIVVDSVMRATEKHIIDKSSITKITYTHSAMCNINLDAVLILLYTLPTYEKRFKLAISLSAVECNIFNLMKFYFALTSHVLTNTYLKTNGI